MAVKKVLVGVDDEVWRKVKARAADEGRTVAVLVENALKLYLGAPFERVIPAQAPMSREAYVASVAKPTVESLRALMASVPAAAPPLSPRPIEARLEARERLQRIAERQQYLKDHPEEEQQ